MMRRKIATGSVLLLTLALTLPPKSFSQEESKMPYYSSSSVNVDPHSGSASTAVPIVVVQGRGGIEPAISLNYNSSIKNGILGVGWALEFGSIVRSVKKGVPPYKATDDFLLIQNNSTQELVFDNTAGFYRTKIEGAFLKIERLNDYWVITDRSNIKYYFGKDQQARLMDSSNTSRIFKWNLNRVEDQLGNFMNITYIREGNNLYPQNIEYTGNSFHNLDPYAQVNFELENRPDPSFSYRTGFKVSVNKRIKSISVLAEGHLQRKYILHYSESPISKRSLLEKVISYGSDGKTVLPTMEFSYRDQMPGSSHYIKNPEWSLPAGSKFSNKNNDRDTDLAVRIVDVNGDAYPDMVRNYRKNGQNNRHVKQVYLNNKNNGWVLTSKYSLPKINPFLDGWPEIDREWGIRFADVNGDGFVDMAQYFKQDKWRGGAITNAVYINNKTNGWDLDPQWKMPQNPETPIVEERGCPKYNYHDFQGSVFADVNGDGFVDYVRSKEGFAESHRTYLNNAAQGKKGWQRDSTWDTPNSKYTDFAKGATLVDLNGDGLPEIFYSKANVVKIFLNIGKGWKEDKSSPWLNLPTPGDLTKGNTQFGDINGDGLVDMMMTNSPTIFLINTGHGWKQEKDVLLNKFKFRNFSTRLADVNGDGWVDVVIHNDRYQEVYLNQNDYADLLIKIENGYGGETEIVYTSSTKFDNPDLPFSLPVVKDVTLSNGSNYKVKTQYAYAHGIWQRQEKEFRGFQEVKTMDADGNYSLSQYLQDDIYKGRLSVQASYDAEGNLYAKTENTWAHEEVSEGVNFVYLKRTDQYLFDGNETGRRTAKEYFYEEAEPFGNVTKSIDYGDVDLFSGEDIGSDKRIEETEYHNLTGHQRLLGIVKQSVLKDQNQHLLAQTFYYYDGSPGRDSLPVKGFLTKKEQWAGDGAKDINPVIEYVYDDFGNVIQTKDPLGNVSRVRYDTQYHMFLLVAQNALSYQAFSEYYGIEGVPLDDGKGYQGLWGQLKSQTDVNGKRTLKTYDSLGRVTKIIGPLDSFYSPGKEIQYDSFQKITTKQRVRNNAFGTIDIKSYYDGFGQLSKTERPKSDGSSIISGAQKYNKRGLVFKKYMTYLKEKRSEGSILESLFDIIFHRETDPARYTEIIYDAMGRPIKTINPDGTYATAAYDDGTTTMIDANGHMQKSYVDSRGQLIKKEEYLGADGRSAHYPFKAYTLYAVTHYAYDLQGNLIQTMDADGNITRMTYDTLGRKIAIDDPDMGLWRYGYDLNGNLIWQTDAKGQTIEFTYDALNRLVNKSDGGDLNVDYVYDDNSLENSKGKLTSIQYPHGEAEFVYDPIGREIESIKRINDVEYNVDRNYDAINNLMDLKYPDGRKLKYEYNDEGQVESIEVNQQSFMPSAHADHIPSIVDREIKEIAAHTIRNQQTSITEKIASSLGKAYTNFFEPYVLGVGTAEAMSRLFRKKNPPNRPIMTIDDFGYDYAVIRWIESKEAKGYYVKYGTDSKNLNIVIDAGNVVNYEIGNLKPQTRYFFAVTAYNQYGESDESNLDTMMTLAKPADPVQFSGIFVKNIAYNIHGQMVKIEYGNNVITNYIYDELTFRLKRLLSANRRGEVLQDLNYTYDSVGNVLTIIDKAHSATQRFQYDALNRLIRAQGSYGVKEYVYDEIGNIVEKDYNRYYYGEGGAGVHAVTTRIDGSVRITYTYDANGNMATKQRNSSELTEYRYDVENRLIEVVKDDLKIAEYEYDGDGGRTKSIIYDGYGSETSIFVGPLFERSYRGDTNYIFLGSTRIASMTGENVLFYHGDHLGSTNVVTDTQGQIKELLEYEPFGKISHQERFGTDEEVAMFHFTGKRFSDDTGLYFFESRYYDPELGRFIQADTIVQDPNGNPQTFNRYSYCGNNPVNHIDPTGHSWWKKFWKTAVTAIVGTVLTVISAGTLAPIVGAYWAGVSTGALAGATIGGTFAAATGGNIGMGVLTGFVGGGLFAGLAPGLSAFSDGIFRGITLGGAAGPLGSGLSMGSNFVSCFLGGAASGVAMAGINGADVGQGALIGGAFAGAFSVIRDTSLWMRAKMVQQSRLDPRNASGKSVGFNNDGFKLGGGRFDPTHPNGNPSPLGGHQGGQGQIFGMPYSSGSMIDRIVEGYAGPHDFLNSWGYDQFGNLQYHVGFERVLGATLNPLNVVIATPIAVPSAFPRVTYPGPGIVYGLQKPGR